MILQLQNQISLKVWSSWGVTEKISKLPCWRGLQKNHAQLQFYKGFPCKLKILWVWVWQNFKITLVRGHQVSPSQPTDQPTNQQTNQASKQASDLPTNQPANQPINQPVSQPAANQPTKQPTNQSELRIVKSNQNKPANKQVKQIKQAK